MKELELINPKDELILSYNQQEVVLLTTLYLLNKELSAEKENPKFIHSSLDQAFVDLNILIKIRLENPTILFGNDCFIKNVTQQLNYIRLSTSTKYETELY
jgi:hypothetical protein